METLPSANRPVTVSVSGTRRFDGRSLNSTDPDEPVYRGNANMYVAFKGLGIIYTDQGVSMHSGCG